MISRLIALMILCVALPLTVQAQGRQTEASDAEFGPVVRAYLGYLRNEQEVVDDRASRHEVNRAYYRRNSNRIRALRQMAIKIARESSNDYLPELEAVTRDEFGIIFENPPRLTELEAGQVLENKFKFLGTIRSAEIFYIFERLSIYEQAELMEKNRVQPANPDATTAKPANENETLTRQRRVTTP